MPPSARPRVDSIDDVAQPRSRTPLALHPSEGEADLKIEQNGQVKALSCMFYVASSRAGQTVHVLWNERTLEIFDDDGEYIVSYPRPVSTGFYYGPRTPNGTAMKGAGHNPSAGSIGTAVRTVSKGGYIGVLASKFYAGYRRKGEQVTVAWDATTVTLRDASGATIAQYAKPTHRRGWHGPQHSAPSTKS